MNNDSPFASFVPSTPAEGGQAGEPAKKPRKPRTKKAAKPAPAKSEPVADPPKVPRARKSVGAAKARKPRSLKIDLALAMSALAGLQEDDAKFVTSLVQAMQPFAKKQRARIVAALARIFA